MAARGRPDPPWKQVASDEALKQLATLLAEGPEGMRNLAALAHEVGLSERSLELLTDGLPVTETSLDVGYESTGAFIRAFRQVVGMKPATYAQ